MKGAALIHKFPTGAKGTWTVTPLSGASCGAAPTAAEGSLTRTIDLPRGGGCDYAITLSNGVQVADPTTLETTVTANGKKLFPAE